MYCGEGLCIEDVPVWGIDMIAGLKPMVNDHSNGYKIASFLFIPLLVLFTLPIFEPKIGLTVLFGAVLVVASLVRQTYIYYLLISLFSVEGFAAFENASYPKIVGFVLMTGLMLRLFLTQKAIPKDSSYKYFFLFFTGSVVSFAFAKNILVSLEMYVTYISLFMLYVFTRYFLKNMDDIHKALNYIFFSTIAISAAVSIMHLSVRSQLSSRISSGMADPNEFASFIVALCPLALYRATRRIGISKVVYWAVLVACLMLLADTGSRGGMLGFLGALAILTYHRRVAKMRHIAILFILVAVTAFFFGPDDLWFRASTIIHPEAESQIHGTSIAYREHAYVAALKMFLDNPVAGVGLYNFQFESSKYGMARALVVHNTYLEMLTGGGLLSFIPFLLILIDSWRKLNIRVRTARNMEDFLICLKASFASILITSFFLSADHKKILWFLLALISSAFYIAVEENKKSRAGLR